MTTTDPAELIVDTGATIAALGGTNPATVDDLAAQRDTWETTARQLAAAGTGRLADASELVDGQRVLIEAEVCAGGTRVYTVRPQQSGTIAYLDLTEVVVHRDLPAQAVMDRIDVTAAELRRQIDTIAGALNDGAPGWSQAMAATNTRLRSQLAEARQQRDQAAEWRQKCIDEAIAAIHDAPQEIAPLLPPVAPADLPRAVRALIDRARSQLVEALVRALTAETELDAARADVAALRRGARGWADRDQAAEARDAQVQHATAMAAIDAEIIDDLRAVLALSPGQSLTKAVTQLRDDLDRLREGVRALVRQVETTVHDGRSLGIIAQAPAASLLNAADRLRALLDGAHTPTSPPSATRTVLDELAQERARQDAKWGQQNHPDGTGPEWPAIPLGGAFTADRRNMARLACQSAASHGTVTWHHILSEEVHEAFAEEDPAKLRAELVQTAAVAVAWIEAIDRRLAALSATETAEPGDPGVTQASEAQEATETVATFEHGSAMYEIDHLGITTRELARTLERLAAQATDATPTEGQDPA